MCTILKEISPNRCALEDSGGLLLCHARAVVCFMLGETLVEPQSILLASEGEQIDATEQPANYGWCSEPCNLARAMVSQQQRAEV